MTMPKMPLVAVWTTIAAVMLLAAGGTALAAEPRALGPGDVVAITTGGEPDLTGEFTLGEDGELAGQTLNEAAETLKNAIATIRRNPVVTVKLARPRTATVSVVGAIRQPGQVTLPLPATVIEAIAAAGGFDERADRSQVTWVHEGEARTLDLIPPVAGSEEIADRDVLIVPTRAMGVVTMAGAVAKEGIYPLDPAQPMRLSQALLTAGGAAPLAMLDQAVLTHADGTKQTVNLQLGPDGMGPDGDIVIRDGDILYVPERSRRENAVYVFGAAVVQGLFDFREGMTLLEVLSAAQPQPYAKLGEIAIYRKGANNKASRIAAGDAVRGKRPDIPLLRDDLVIVPGSPPCLDDWCRFLAYLSRDSPPCPGRRRGRPRDRGGGGRSCPTAAPPL